MRRVRFRTLGCYPLIGRRRERRRTRAGDHPRDAPRPVSERQGRVIDRDSEGSMEKKKREGYF